MLSFLKQRYMTPKPVFKEVDETDELVDEGEKFGGICGFMVSLIASLFCIESY